MFCFRASRGSFAANSYFGAASLKSTVLVDGQAAAKAAMHSSLICLPGRQIKAFFSSLGRSCAASNSCAPFPWSLIQLLSHSAFAASFSW